jgi:hypothetical protein
MFNACGKSWWRAELVIKGWKGVSRLMKGDVAGALSGGRPTTLAWARAGFEGWPDGGGEIPKTEPTLRPCQYCPVCWTGEFRYHWDEGRWMWPRGGRQ